MIAALNAKQIFCRGRFPAPFFYFFPDILVLVEVLL